MVTVFVPLAVAHGTETPGTVLVPTLGLSRLEVDPFGPVFSLVEELAPGLIPNGAFYFVIMGVAPGSNFEVTADDGSTPIVVGTATTCPGPEPAEDYDNRTPLDGQPFADDALDRLRFWLEDPGNNVWLYCVNYPDFDVRCVRTWNTPGDEEGVADCYGIVVFLVIGDPGESFTYHEGF